MASQHELLIIVERAYRGSIETQFADVLYFIRELNRQTGGLDLELRGLAASYAIATDYTPVVAVGSHTVDDLPDPRRAVRHLLDENCVVWVAESDLAVVGASAAGRLEPRVRCRTEPELIARWPSYQRVMFM